MELGSESSVTECPTKQIFHLCCMNSREQGSAADICLVCVIGGTRGANLLIWKKISFCIYFCYDHIVSSKQKPVAERGEWLVSLKWEGRFLPYSWNQSINFCQCLIQTFTAQKSRSSACNDFEEFCYQTWQGEGGSRGGLLMPWHLYCL